ncbi:MAG: FkbM family methyltransferase [Bacteroidota bacterium]
MDSARNLIYRKIKEKGLNIKTCCEVGVYLPETSNVIDFINDGIKTILVEPDPSSIKAIKEKFKDFKNITLHEVAIFDKKGTISLSKANASTFVSELPYSPAIINDKYEVKESESFEVPCEKFSSLDPGDIDLLSIDTEGCEWYVLQDLKSQPLVISIETHGKMYINPYIQQILDWMAAHGYKAWFKDKSDTVFYKEKLFEISTKEKTDIIQMNLKLGITRFIKSIARFFSKK